MEWTARPCARRTTGGMPWSEAVGETEESFLRFPRRTDPGDGAPPRQPGTSPQPGQGGRLPPGSTGERGALMADRAMSNTAFQPGTRVTWRYEQRGGWGYVIPVAAVVVRVGPKRVLIRAASRRIGGEWRIVERWVRPDRLRSRDEYVPVVDERWEEGNDA